MCCMVNSNYHDLSLRKYHNLYEIKYSSICTYNEKSWVVAHYEKLYQNK